MTASGLERARQVLNGGDLEALLGERECAWLDVKSGVYPLEVPKGPEELAKDVAAFANTSHGGLLLVGFTTRKEHGEEIVAALNPVPRERVDLDRYRQIIATRVLPALREVTVTWIPQDNDLGVLVIDIPAQPRSSQLFAIPAPTGTTEVSKTAVSVPVRRGDATTWLRPSDIQHLIGLGWANSDDRVDKLAAALAAVQTPRVEEPKHTVGEPGWGGVFQQAVGDLAEQGVTLGVPVSDVDLIGPGVAQHFDVPGQRASWVLCAQPQHRPVAVAGEIWQALRDQGSSAPDGNAVSALGLPVGDRTIVRVIDRNVTEVALSGGGWGRGRLLRGSDRHSSSWRWVPDPIPSTMMSASTRNWTGALTPPQLRARVLAILPFADTDTLKITPDRLDALVQELPINQLAGFTTNLTRWRGRELRAGVWAMGPNGNTSDRLSYASEITTPDGELAVAAEVMMTLPPTTRNSAIVTCAEVRVESFDTWARALHADPVSDLRWSMGDLFEFFVAARETATELLPRLIVDAPSHGRWSGVPRVELWVAAGQRHDQSGAQPVLADVLRLEDFGPSGGRGQLSELFVSVPSVPGLGAEAGRRLARSVLVEMAHSYGFMQVREDIF